jgi:phage FluMu protein Com
MASEETKAADQKIEEENFHTSLAAEEETDAFQCPRCKQVLFVLFHTATITTKVHILAKVSLPTSTDAKR